jgi:hypothetical protein
LPLGGAWAGTCTAGCTRDPTESIQREICNSGYARGRCDHFPEGGVADAVRFSVTAGGRLIYILEKDHAPIEHGEIDGMTDTREPLASLARAFWETHRKTPASAAATAAAL